MIRFWLRRSLFRQAAALLLAALAAAALDRWLAPTPLVRFHEDLLLQGAVAGCFIAAVAATLHAIGFWRPRSGYAEALGKLREKGSPDEFTSAGMLFIGAAEEVLFRGYVFNALLAFGAGWAFALHGAAALLSHYAGRDVWIWTLVRVVEAQLLAYLYFVTRSLTACVTAHLVIAVLEEIFVRLAFSRFPAGKRFTGARVRLVARA
jgi:membrane protease YdiL (CAAX protease family)